MKRRSFLKSTGAIVPIFINGSAMQAMSHRSLFDFINMDNDKVLVLIELNGGNDGLNSTIPLDAYDNLMRVRSNVMIPKNRIISVTDTMGFHPSMQGFKHLYEDALLTIIQGVGYPNQNRSHFRSRDIWTSASAADEIVNSGWLGRRFDGLHPIYPENYPNESFPDPLALTVGALVSETCQGLGSNFSLAIESPDNLTALPLTPENEIPDTAYGYELKYLSNSIKQTNAYGEVLTSASEQGRNLSSLYPDAESNALAEQLKSVARLIDGGLKTKIFILGIGGFDTHGNQVERGDTTQGEHATLLQYLTEAIQAFQDDLKLLGLDKRVLGMTFSEFGRRIRSNSSLGTDHGSAAPMFLFGSCANPGIIGQNAEVSDQVDQSEGVAMQYDFRDIYGSVLIDWFEVPENEVKTLLHDNFQYLPLVTGCNATASNEEIIEQFQFVLTPNPVYDNAEIQFSLEDQSPVRISIFDVLGSELDVISNQRLASGSHTIRFESRALVAGSYFLRLQAGNQVATKKFVKL